jgi:transcription-repair coupling factor (superfamily II helicase)
LILEGLTASARAYVLAGLSEGYGKVVVMAANEESARDLYEDLLTWLPDHTAYYPVADVWSAQVEPETAAQRVLALDLMNKPGPVVLVGPVQAMLQRTARDVKTVRVTQGQTLDLASFLDRLVELGYERALLVERPGQFAVRGGILDIFPSTEERPLRVELFDDQVESLRVFEVESQRSLQRVEELELLPAREGAAGDLGPILLQGVPQGSLVVLDEPNKIQGHWVEYEADFHRRLERHAQEEDEDVELRDSLPSRDLFLTWEQALPAVLAHRRLYLNNLPRSVEWDPRAPKVAVPSGSLDRYAGQLSELATAVKDRLGAAQNCAVLTNRHHRLSQLLTEEQVPVSLQNGWPERTLYIRRGRLSAGFSLNDLRLIIYSDLEVFGERHLPRPRHHFKSGAPILSMLDLKEGDFVVHVNHGIGIYHGLARLQQDGTEQEFLQIDYAAGDKIYVPTDQLDRVQRYIGSDDGGPQITRLGSGAWQKTTAKAKQRVREMAKDLIQLYAARAAAERSPFSPDTVWQTEMEEAFPYRETPDQLKAIQDVKQDLQHHKPMDRLVCGDVGYGKTEVAVRAAFKAVQDHRQVAVLVPTTVLAQQHFETFSERMEGFPLRIELLSRFRTAKEQKSVVEGLKDGSVDIVIGTHMLLGKTVHFQDLGLLIVDEEQRFGVGHKEKLKQLKKSVDVLTLTATPIPRTMHMSLSGLRDMSIINNPPEGRAPIKTYVTEYSDQVVRRAINRELDRGGQVYFLFNRVDKIEHMAARVEKLIPHAKVGVGHGQMPERMLEQVMWDFYHKKFDILVCTTIIESGLDIPNVNTMVVMDADHLGLSQLYQLRGRVGRSDRQAYCYLFYRRSRVLTEAAEKRLEAIRDFTDLGSGFKVAMRDLEIRGAGNLLGAEQSGVMVSVGFELYCQMISEAVKELRGEVEHTVVLPPVELAVDAYLPDEYIPTEGLRIAFYKKLAAVRDVEELKALQAEFEDRFGDPPTPVWNLLALLRTRLLAHELNLKSVTGDRRRVRFNFRRLLNRGDMVAINNRFRNWSAMAEYIEVTLRTDDTLREVDENLRLLARLLQKGQAVAKVPLPSRRAATRAAKRLKLPASRVLGDGEEVKR